jgi:wobble nucleotide-excising tRNase
MYIDRLWFGSHHLPEYILIDDKVVNDLLNKINNLVGKYGDNIKDIEDIYEDIRYYDGLNHIIIIVRCIEEILQDFVKYYTSYFEEL